MKIALAADFHLDFRQFNRQQRWQDYVNTFVKVTRKVAESDPNIYIIAGDLFERYRPHAGVIRRFLKEIARLDCPVILIRGNHDSPQIFFEKFGGDILHLLQDVAEIVYLNREHPSYELNDVCFIGLGYIGFNADREIARHVKKIITTKTKIGVFHQLLDYPGVPENRVEVSRSFLRGLGLDYILTGHWHLKYEEERVFNPGSPEYWSFDQAEQIEFNLDTGEEKITPAKEKGFYLIDTTNGKGEFIKVDPARSMHCITYQTNSFDETKHISMIKRHSKKYNIHGSMVKTVIKGRCKYGQISLGNTITLDNPLIHIVARNLTPSDADLSKVDTIEAQSTYLTDRGIKKGVAKKIAEWLEHGKNDLATMQSNELLHALRSILQSENDRTNKD
jgi:predicted phosphodiesterase